MSGIVIDRLVYCNASNQDIKEYVDQLRQEINLYNFPIKPQEIKKIVNLLIYNEIVLHTFSLSNSLEQNNASCD